jgi:hypothetical protein
MEIKRHVETDSFDVILLDKKTKETLRRNFKSVDDLKTTLKENPKSVLKLKGIDTDKLIQILRFTFDSKDIEKDMVLNIFNLISFPFSEEVFKKALDKMNNKCITFDKDLFSLSNRERLFHVFGGFTKEEKAVIYYKGLVNGFFDGVFKQGKVINFLEFVAEKLAK